MTVRHVRCIIVGCAGAGKTTLLRKLKNLTFEEIKSIESTEIVDVHVNCLCLDTERDENDNSDNEDTTEDTALLVSHKIKIEIAKEDINEKSRTLLSNSPDKALAKSKSNSCSSLYTLEKTHGQSESNEFIRFDSAHDGDERYALSKIIDDIKKLPSENLIRPRITFVDFAGQSLYYSFHQVYLSPSIS